MEGGRVRAALISLLGQPRDPGHDQPLAIAGKTLAQRQLEFALSAGCDSVIALGDGSTAEAIALRHAAEAAGARFQTVRDSHGLLGAVRADDELLALAPGLLPEAADALEGLGKRKGVLGLPAGPGVAAGFERLDLNRAWAGAPVVGGAQVELLSDLPPDIEPTSALVRIALQARLPERTLSEALLVDGTWSMVADRTGAVAIERAWFSRHLPAARPAMPTGWLAVHLFRRFGKRMLAAPPSRMPLLAGAALFLVGSVAATAFEQAVLGFALLAIGAFLALTGGELAYLRRVPFAGGVPAGLAAAMPWLVDGALLACGILAAEGTGLQRAFPPLVLLGALYAARPELRSDWAPLLGDRGLLAVLFAVASGLAILQPAIMLVALVLIALNVAQTHGRSG